MGNDNRPPAAAAADSAAAAASLSLWASAAPLGCFHAKRGPTKKSRCVQCLLSLSGAPSLPISLSLSLNGLVLIYLSDGRKGRKPPRPTGILAEF